MARGKGGGNKDKCKRYFDQRRRIKNKQRKQDKMLAKLEKRNPEAAEKVRNHNVIGRRKEGAGRWATSA